MAYQPNGAIYVIHFFPHDDPEMQEAYGKGVGGRHLHYIGWVKHSKNLERRMKEHRSGKYGSKMTNAAVRRGVRFEFVRIFQGTLEQPLTMNEEKRLRNRGETKRFCPICNPDAIEKYPFNRDKYVVSDLELNENYWIRLAKKHNKPHLLKWI